MTFQRRVLNWLMACFSQEICRDTTERNHRFLEEALELVQSTGCTRSEAHQLVDYVFGRPVGDPFQEVGGVAITFSALCSCIDIDHDDAGEAELARISAPEIMEKIRAKQADKPKHSPLPMVESSATGWAAWHPTKGFFDEFEPDGPIASASLDGAARRVRTLNSDEGTNNRNGWRAVKVRIERVL
ncbi:hypothetical protein ACQR1I_36645 [Bradyrhizobium sp. HKCCYLS2038]|uniref:hypothetical protein n=1 Tax=Bradyrhizobium sp. HKCCYLS2038 TaxID=3420764 RepID=UPI003EBE5741